VRTHTARGWESERVESRAVAASWAPAAPRASRPAPGRHWHCATRRTTRDVARRSRVGVHRRALREDRDRAECRMALDYCI